MIMSEGLTRVVREPEKKVPSTRGFTIAASVGHVLAAAIAIPLWLLTINDCDLGDRVFASLGVAAMVDVIAGCILFVAALLTSARRRMLARWALMFLPAWMALVIALWFANSLGSGCPV